MQRSSILASLLYVSACLPTANAQDAANPTPQTASATNEAIRMLPTGSVLKNILLPRYDANYQLSSTLRADKITVTSEDTLAADNLTLQLYEGEKRQERARLHLLQADYRKSTGYLTSQSNVQLTSTQFILNGSGLRFHTPTKRGFIYGPISSFLRPNPNHTTAMSTFSPSKTTTLLALSLSSLLATPPTPLTEQEKQQLTQALPLPSRETPTTTQLLQNTQNQLENSNLQLTEFLTQASLASTILQHEPVPQPQPLNIQPNPNDTKIESDGGVYFDAEKGTLVYLKNVRVTSPQFSLTGANELHVFLAKKPSKPSTEKSQSAQNPTPQPLTESFGDVEKIVAQGVLQITQNAQNAPQKNQTPIQASSTRLTFYQKTNELILSGGYPWVKQGDKYLRAKQPNLYLRIQKDGSFRTEGNWEMGGQISQPTSH